MGAKVVVEHDKYQQFKERCNEAKIPFEYLGKSDDGVYVSLTCPPSTAHIICDTWDVVKI